VAELGQPDRAQPDLVAREPDSPRPDRLADLPVDVEQRVAHDRERRPAREPAAVDERHLEPRRLHRRRDLWPAAVDNDGVAKLAEA
jgi:hypothetical protein